MITKEDKAQLLSLRHHQILFLSGKVKAFGDSGKTTTVKLDLGATALMNGDGLEGSLG